MAGGRNSMPCISLLGLISVILDIYNFCKGLILGVAKSSYGTEFAV